MTTAVIHSPARKKKAEKKALNLRALPAFADRHGLVPIQVLQIILVREFRPTRN